MVGRDSARHHQQATFESVRIDIVNVGYGSTNYYVLGSDARRLLVDVGWPGTLPKLLAILKRKGVAPGDIRFLLATHYHPDHAGIAQELKAKGVRLVVMSSQRDALLRLGTYMKPGVPYVEISPRDNVELSSPESRAFLATLGLPGTIVETPGHTDDSVSLVLDDGPAFTGDLPPESLAETDVASEVARSWNVIHSLRATMIHPGHGPVRPLSFGGGPA